MVERKPQQFLRFLLIVVALFSLIFIQAKREASRAIATSSFTDLSPIADSYVRNDQPSSNFGLKVSLQVDGSPIKISYLKFDLTNLSGVSVISAKLRLKVIDSSSSVQNVKLVGDNSWTENGITYNNRAVLDSTLATLQGGKAGNWVEIDITPIIADHLGQIVSIGIDSSGSDGIDFNSREANADPPVLHIEYQDITPSSSPSVSPAPSPSPTFTPTPTPTPLAGGDTVIAAAGDIACDPVVSSSFNGGNGTSSNCRMLATSDLILNINPAAVLPLGDNQYYCGGYSAFQQSYDLSWGRFKSITHPAVGNHEYLTSGGTGCDATNAGAAGYFKYFGAAAGDPSKGYYSYDIGSWHFIVLNSQCSAAGGCSATSPQGQWLNADLAEHRNLCTLAYYHIPLFSSGGRANDNTKALFQILYNNNADVVLTGHDHLYERFAPQDPNGVADSVRGIREFVVGTGGANHTSVASIAANSEIRNDTTYGVLKMILKPAGYDWQFVPEAGKIFTDSGSQSCH